MKQEIAFSRGLISIPAGNPRLNNKAAAYSCAAEIARLGYVVDAAALDQMVHLSSMELRSLTSDVVAMIRAKLGATRPYKPFYVNFPESVMEMSHFELFFNAIVHYWSEGTWEPAQELRTRGPFTEMVEMSPLKYVTENEFRNIFTNMAGSAQSLSPFNKRALEWFVKNYDRSELRMPSSVPFKETLALLATLGCDVPVKHETDVLRIALAMSGVDPAILPVPKVGTTKEGTVTVEDRRSHQFRKFSRPERKFLLSLLEQTRARAEELQVHKDRWVRLGEVLHVGDYATAFPKSYEAFRAIRNQRTVKVRTFASNLDYAMKNKDGVAALSLLCSRPGEFARRLDALMRSFNPHDVLTHFSTVADKVSSKVQLELVEHLINRAEVTTRTIVTKGARTATSLETLEALPGDVVERGVNILLQAISHNLAALPKMGKVYLDPQLMKLPLNKGARTQSEGASAIPRGTREAFPENTNVIRGFVHWYDHDATEDIDLSVGLYSANFDLLDQVSFTNLKSAGVYHSGDIRRRRGSCAEYIDIDMNVISKYFGGAVRYAALVCYNFQNRPMSTMKECFVGFMGRNQPQSGEIFEPKTVKNVMAPQSKSTSVLPCVFDLKKRETIWVDLDMQERMLDYGRDSQIVDNIKMYIDEPNLSMYDLLTLHVTARGGKLVEEAEADEVFTYRDLSLDAGKAASFATW